MKKILTFFISFILIFSLSGCSKEHILTEKDIKTVIENNSLNVLNLENCGYTGDDLELSIENVKIEKSNVHQKDASCDAYVTLSNEFVSAEVFYRFDLKMKKDVWEITNLKNYKKYNLLPKEALDEDLVSEDAKKSISEEYEYTIDSITPKKSEFECIAEVSYTGENDISKFSGEASLTYEFDMETFKWTLKNIEEKEARVNSWNPDGQWRFKDTSYFYKINLSNIDLDNESATIQVIASEYESVIDTADFQQESDIILTKSGDVFYLEPIEVELPETTVTLMLCIKNDGLYFATDQSGEYKKTNLPRYTQNQY